MTTSETVEPGRQLPPYEAPRAVPLAKGRKAASGCKHGNQIEGDCTTGGNPEGDMADCRNGAYADERAQCKRGSEPTY